MRAVSADQINQKKAGSDHPYAPIDEGPKVSPYVTLGAEYKGIEVEVKSDGEVSSKSNNMSVSSKSEETTIPDNSGAHARTTTRLTNGLSDIFDPVISVNAYATDRVEFTKTGKTSFITVEIYAKKTLAGFTEERRIVYSPQTGAVLDDSKRTSLDASAKKGRVQIGAKASGTWHKTPQSEITYKNNNYYDKDTNKKETAH